MKVTNQDYEISGAKPGDNQKFQLRKLGHLVFTTIDCEAEFETDYTYQKKEVGLVRLNFYPEFSVTYRPNPTTKPGEIASPAVVCEQETTPDSKAEGFLAKDPKENTYSVHYVLRSNADPRTLTMKWKAGGTKEGELLCVNKLIEPPTASVTPAPATVATKEDEAPEASGETPASQDSSAKGKTTDKADSTGKDKDKDKNKNKTSSKTAKPTKKPSKVTAPTGGTRTAAKNKKSSPPSSTSAAVAQLFDPSLKLEGKADTSSKSSTPLDLGATEPAVPAPSTTTPTAEGEGSEQNKVHRDRVIYRARMKNCTINPKLETKEEIVMAPRK
jgi:hypothetical protein